jgi:hypothetical protein
MTESQPLQAIMDAWMGSELKATLSSFYQRNPGLIETLDGLAIRLACRPDALVGAVRSHVELGLLRESTVAGKSVYVYNPGRQQELSRLIEDEVERRQAA